MKTTIYICARFGRQEQMREIAKRLDETGDFIVTSSWLYAQRSMNDDDMLPSDRTKTALRDLEDLQKADMLLAFTEPSDSVHGRGGRHVELGMALALKKAVHIVGYRENIFCYLPDVIYHPSFVDFLRWNAKQYW